MHMYLALLRGVNVGGKSMVKMSDLKLALEAAGLKAVRTYIQSGNVIFGSDKTDTKQLAALIEKVVADKFGVESGVVVLTKKRWRDIVSGAPKTWGTDDTWKHNLLVLLEPYDMDEALKAVGELKPGIEHLTAGDGVLYQSLSWKDFGKTTGGKLASQPIYKRVTVRNYNTTQKLRALLEEE